MHPNKMQYDVLRHALRAVYAEELESNPVVNADVVAIKAMAIAIGDNFCTAGFARRHGVRLAHHFYGCKSVHGVHVRINAREEALATSLMWEVSKASQAATHAALAAGAEWEDCMKAGTEAAMALVRSPKWRNVRIP